MVSDDRFSQSSNENNIAQEGQKSKEVPQIKYEDANELRAYFDKMLSEIPNEILKKAAVQVAFPFDWDVLSARERGYFFVMHFRENHPEVSEKFNAAFEEACQIKRIEDKIEKLTLLEPQTVREFIDKVENLEKFQGQLEKANMVFEKKTKKKPEEIVNELRLQGMEDWEIAGVLKQTHNLSSYKIGEILPANPGVTIAPDSVSKRGRNLLKLYEKATVSNPEKFP